MAFRCSKCHREHEDGHPHEAEFKQDIAGLGTITGATDPKTLTDQTAGKIAAIKNKGGRPPGSKNKTSDKPAAQPVLTAEQIAARRKAAERMGRRLATGPFVASAFIMDNPEWRTALREEWITGLQEDYVILAEILGLGVMGKWSAITSLSLNYIETFSLVRAEVRKSQDPIERLVNEHPSAAAAAQKG